ncbi:MAG: signal peptidase I [Alphaproteobacteria bacterium]|nr:signal peptidase I [Alphaproteobacteria bacterium]HCP00502.1 signal peptidase I [Rhodospirillaceae bacterium]
MAKIRNKKSGATMETVRTIIYALLIAGVVRTFAFQPFNIPSGSMIPTLLIGDYLFVSKFSYGFSRYSLPLGLGFFSGRIFSSAPDRGDVAVFRHPPTNRKDFIKRIVGMPGDRVQMVSGRLYINGEVVQRRSIGDHLSRDSRGQVRRVPQYEETLPNGRTYIVREVFGDRGPTDNTREFLVPPNSYFAMGDNRDSSNDSRSWGAVPADNLIGRAEVLFYSTDGTAGWLQPWRWISATRFNRIFDPVD